MSNNTTNLVISKLKLDKKKKIAKANLFYKYLEKRSYIQGVVVLDGMLNCCKVLMPSLKKNKYTIKEAKILSEINSGTTAIAFLNNKKKTTKKILAKLELIQNGRIVRCILVENNNKLLKNYREKVDIYGKHIKKIMKHFFKVEQVFLI